MDTWPPPPGPPAPEPGKLPAWLRGNPFEEHRSPIYIQFDDRRQRDLITWHLVGLLEAGGLFWELDAPEDSLIIGFHWSAS